MIGAAACGPGAHFWWSHWGAGRRSRRRDWWAGALGDAPPRAERGEVRFLVLDAISDRARHGYEVIQHIEERARGRYRPSPGVIYPTLQMLEELAHARVVDREGRKAYEISETGRAELATNKRAVEEFYDRFDEEPWDAYADDFAEVMQGVARLVRAFRRGARAGRVTPATIRAIRRALDEALDKIEDAFGTPDR